MVKDWIYIFPKFIYLSPNHQCEGIWRRGFGEAIRIMKMNPLAPWQDWCPFKTKRLKFSLPYEDVARRQLFESYKEGPHQ